MEALFDTSNDDSCRWTYCHCQGRGTAPNRCGITGRRLHHCSVSSKSSADTNTGVSIDTPQMFSILLSITIRLSVVHGYGQHKVDLSTEELHTCLKFFWIAQTPYKIVVCLNKVSAILLYMRIFISSHFRRLCYCALAIIVGSGVATASTTVFQCVPFERSWDKNVEGTCIHSSEFWLANAVLNILTDVVVLALPIREVSKLQLKLQEKIMLHGIFFLGSL
jgi:hypothetical protein